MSPVLRLCQCGKPRQPGKTRCAEHERADRLRRNRQVAEYGYGSSNWRRVRAARLLQAGYECELKLPGCTGRATHVHLDPRLKGNHRAATPADCRACCAQCSGAVDAPRAS